ncbi:MAG: P-II family nitrogen regulator [Planctomycetota bacterium]
MKLILAIIQPTKLQAVREALAKINVERLTVLDAQGYARQRGQQTATFRGAEYKVDLLRKVVLEIAVNDDFLERTIETIEHVARSGPHGEFGDGKIFILPLAECYQIDGPNKGKSAI